MVVLVVFLSSNLLDPFYYAFAEENNFVVENEIEEIQEDADTEDREFLDIDDEDNDTDINSDGEDSDLNDENNKLNDEEINIDEESVNYEITGDDDPE